MDAYHALAASYDRLTNDVDYEATVDFYMEILHREGVKPRSVVDLACGTGSVTAILARMGYPVLGIDMSEEMLTEAAMKTMDINPMPRFVCQKLQELRLPKAVDMAVCALDSLDYITDPDDCKEAIRRVYKILNPGGIFIFDVNTPEKLQAMAKVRQVLCITHLPQIAAVADGHLLIAKTEREGRTYTEVTPLDREGRKREIARIIGGAVITEKTLASAEEMLK